MGSLFPGPAAGFDQPLDILQGCHERILRNCALVGRIAEHVATRGADAEAASAAAGVIRYFEDAGANHHRDEEHDLFPALREHAPAREAVVLSDLIFQLESDHVKLDELWAGVRTRLEAIAAGRDGGLTSTEAAALAFTYEQHILLENTQLLPLARRVLPAAVLRDLGVRMAARRGVTPP